MVDKLNGINLQSFGYDGYLVLADYLFGAVKSTKNADIDKCKYRGYGILHFLGGQW